MPLTHTLYAAMGKGWDLFSVLLTRATAGGLRVPACRLQSGKACRGRGKPTPRVPSSAVLRNGAGATLPLTFAFEFQSVVGFETEFISQGLGDDDPSALSSITVTLMDAIVEWLRPIHESHFSMVFCLLKKLTAASLSESPDCYAFAAALTSRSRSRPSVFVDTFRGRELG
jgi:hypothetical protein